MGNSHSTQHIEHIKREHGGDLPKNESVEEEIKKYSNAYNAMKKIEDDGITYKNSKTYLMYKMIMNSNYMNPTFPMLKCRSKLQFEDNIMKLSAWEIDFIGNVYIKNNSDKSGTVEFRATVSHGTKDEILPNDEILSLAKWENIAVNEKNFTCNKLDFLFSAPYVNYEFIRSNENIDIEIDYGLFHNKDKKKIKYSDFTTRTWRNFLIHAGTMYRLNT